MHQNYPFKITFKRPFILSVLTNIRVKILWMPQNQVWQVQHGRHCLETCLAEPRSDIRFCTSCKIWSSFCTSCKSRQNPSLILVRLLLSRSVSLFLSWSVFKSWGSVSVVETQTRLQSRYDWDSESLSLWWLSSSLLKWYCDIRFFGHDMPCASIIIMPRSYSHCQEGYTRCACTCCRYSNESRYRTDIVERWNFVQVVHVAFLKQVQVQNWCWLVAELESSALAASLVLLIVHPLVHVCIHNNPAQEGGIRKNKNMYHIDHMLSTCFETYASWALAHYAHQSLHSAAQMYTCFPAHTMIADFRFCVIFSEKSIRYIQNFVVLKNCTVCFTWRYFSYKECRNWLYKFLYYSWLLLVKEGGKIIFFIKRSQTLYHGCTISCQEVHTLTLFFSTTIFTDNAIKCHKCHNRSQA